MQFASWEYISGCCVYAPLACAHNSCHWNGMLEHEYCKHVIYTLYNLNSYKSIAPTRYAYTRFGFNETELTNKDMRHILKCLLLCVKVVETKKWYLEVAKLRGRFDNFFALIWDIFVKYWLPIKFNLEILVEKCSCRGELAKFSHLFLLLQIQYCVDQD